MYVKKILIYIKMINDIYTFVIIKKYYCFFNNIYLQYNIYTLYIYLENVLLYLFR